MMTVERVQGNVAVAQPIAPFGHNSNRGTSLPSALARGERLSLSGSEPVGSDQEVAIYISEYNRTFDQQRKLELIQLLGQSRQYKGLLALVDIHNQSFDQQTRLAAIAAMGLPRSGH